ncbi:MAG: chemotaxis-specific protein-glutamate methyltransferase CheB [Candidatus Latescibacteria bacterium]|nr:chemotaxis-specific protein-glutamate methyltransferase CheB [Candidatus Latescibacterota bacterium]
MRRIRVLIVEDSAVVREFLQYLIGQDPRLEVAAAVGSAEEALRILDQTAPDVISMDIRLPGMNGFEATRRIMAQRPTPIVVVSSSVESEDLKISMNALRAGALTIIEKPVGTAHADYEVLAERICTQLAIMSQVKVIRQRPGREAVTASPTLLPLKGPAGPFWAMGVVASTGGPNALAELLNGLQAGFPLPILLVQHITASFLEGFAVWLNHACPQEVVIAKEGEVPAPGKVYLAPPDRHLKLENRCLRVDGSPPVCAQRPSGTVLFQSMAHSLGAQALGVLLTGMGEDGAEGLLEIRQAGGHTIAEDESTAVVYGMPGAAARLGAVSESLPLPAIAPRILELALIAQERA